MHYDSLVSMNITYNGSTLNGKYPILFYWNGKNDPVDDICSDEKIRALVRDKVASEDMYEKTEVNFATYKFDGEAEKYEECTFKVSDYFTYGDISRSIAEGIVVSILDEVHQKVFGMPYEANPMDSFSAKADGIVTAIRSKYKKEITKETIVNYIRKIFKDRPGQSNRTTEENEKIIVEAATAVVR